MMPNLVQHCASQQITRGDLLGFATVPDAPLISVPGFPVPNLSVRREQQDAPTAHELNSEDQARIVGVTIELERKLAGCTQPIIIDVAPEVLMGFVVERVVAGKERHCPG